MTEGAKGEQGEAGEQGETGERGKQGERGMRGDPGVDVQAVATDQLNTTVDALTEALNTLAKMQKRQAELDAQVKATARTTMPRKDIEEAWAGEERKMRTIRRTSIAYLAIALVASGITLIVANLFASASINQIKESRYESCVARNKQNVAATANQRTQIQPILKEAEAAKFPNQSPALIALLSELATVQASVVVCTR